MSKHGLERHIEIGLKKCPPRCLESPIVKAFVKALDAKH